MMDLFNFFMKQPESSLSEEDFNRAKQYFHGGIRMMDIESRQVIPAEDRLQEQIASDLYELLHDAEKSEPSLSFYQACREYLKGIGNQTSSCRYSFMIESSVPGSFFS